jgi:hypothetical protein
VNASRTYIDVDCERTAAGDLIVQVPLDPNETIVEVNATVENADNISKSFAAVMRHDERSAVIRYSLRGLDRNTFGLNCPGGGHATIVANFVISRNISAPGVP